MRSRRFRLWLLLALAAGVSSCEIDQINPQPPLPGNDPAGPGLSTGGTSMTGEGQTAGSTTTPSAGGSLSLNPAGGSSSAGIPPIVGTDGGSDAAGGAGDASGAGGAGDASDAGGAGGAAGAVDVGPK